MRSLCLISILFVSFHTISSQDLYFPPLLGGQWESSTVDELGWCEDEVEPLYDFLNGSDSKAFILLKNGKIVLEKYFDDFTQDSFWYWASAGKTLTASLIGIAQEEGLLSIEDSSSDYLGTDWTNCSIEDQAQITIKNQLSMTSGMNDAFANSCTLPVCLNCIAEPGERWAYHTGAYTLLTDIIEISTDKSLNTYMYQKIKSKTGMGGLYFKLGSNVVFYSKARTMARFGLLMLNQGDWKDTPVITDPDFYHDMINSSQSINPAYGYLWWLNGKETYRLPASQTDFSGMLFPNAPDDTFAALGKNGQLINITPSQNLVWIRMGNKDDETLAPNYFNDSIWVKINAIMCTDVGTKDNEIIEPNISIFPNPATSVLHVEIENYSSKDKFEIEIITGVGDRISKREVRAMSTKLDVAHLLPGVYFVKIVSKKTIITKMFLKD